MLKKNVLYKHCHFHHPQSIIMRLKSIVLMVFLLTLQSSYAEVLIHNPQSPLQKTVLKTHPSLLSRIKVKVFQLLLKQQIIRKQKKLKYEKSEKLGKITGPVSLVLLIGSIFVLFLTWPQNKFFFIATVVLSFIAAIITLTTLPKRTKDGEFSAKARKARRMAAVTLGLMLGLGLIALLIASISFEIG